MPPMDHHERYYLGLQAWAFPGWRDRYLTDRPSQLASYAGVFNSVEGNTTFYRTPDDRSVKAWRDAVDGRAFRFCFKLPRAVTHERRPELDALSRFLDAIEPLRDHLGPLLVQFPATLRPDDLASFEPVFAALDGRFRFVVEVRHMEFFSQPERLEPVLDRFGAGRVVLDSRPLYEGDRRHPDVLRALHRKPDLPVLPSVYNGVAFVRLILHPDVVSNRRYIDEWARWAGRCIADGVETYMMIHCPNYLHCPPLARTFHEALIRQPGAAGLPDLPPWPIPRQQDLLM